MLINIQLLRNFQSGNYFQKLQTSKRTRNENFPKKKQSPSYFNRLTLKRQSYRSRYASPLEAIFRQIKFN